MPAPAARDAAITALATALGARRGRVVRRRVGVGLAAAAAVALCAVGLVQLDRGGRVTLRLDRGPFLATGTTVRADSERTVSLTLSTGTRLQLSDRGRLRVAELGPRQQFEMETGRLWAHVSPLARRQRFLIQTPDAEIEVRGTAFEVVVAPEQPPCGGGVTQVKVSEGLVTVRRGNQLWQVSAGRRWPDVCPPTGPVDVPAAVTNVDSPRHPGTASKPASLARVVAPSARTRTNVARQRQSGLAASNLREQNELFAAAMEARRLGDVAAARRALDDLLARFPFGALAESARAELAAVRAPSAGGAGAPP